MDTPSLLFNPILVCRLFQKGITELVLYGDSVHKFKRIVGKPNFSDQFRKIIKRYKNGCNMDIMRQSASLVVNPITVYNNGFLFKSGLRLNDALT